MSERTRFDRLLDLLKRDAYDCQAARKHGRELRSMFIAAVKERDRLREEAALVCQPLLDAQAERQFRRDCALTMPGVTQNASRERERLAINRALEAAEDLARQDRIRTLMGTRNAKGDTP